MVIQQVAANVARQVREHISGTPTLNVNAVAVAALMPRSTLKRRLIDGDFTVSELQRVASALDLDPAELLKNAAA